MGFYSTPGPLHLSLVRDLRSTQKPDLAIKSTLNKIYLQGGFFIVIIFLLRQFYARSHWETNKGWKEEVGEGPSLWGTAWCASGCINQVSTFPNNNNNKNQAVQQRQRAAGKTAPRHRRSPGAVGQPAPTSHHCHPHPITTDPSHGTNWVQKQSASSCNRLSSSTPGSTHIYFLQYLKSLWPSFFPNLSQLYRLQSPSSQIHI